MLGVDVARYVEKGAGDTLHACDAAFIKFGCGCGVWRLLNLGPIRRRELFVGRVLRVCVYGMLEALQGFADGVGHGDVNIIIWLVLIDGKSTVIAAR